MPRHHKGYASKDAYTTRLWKHPRKRRQQHYCPACPKFFETEEDFREHWKEKHDNEEGRKMAAIITRTWHRVPIHLGKTLDYIKKIQKERVRGLLLRNRKISLDKISPER